jgi:hypothetical protein
VSGRAIAAALLLLAGTRAEAQRISAGAQYAFSEYAEQGSSLRFDGAGPAAHVSVGWRRFDLGFSVARLSFAPSEAGDATQPFDMAQTEIRLRVRAARLVSVEAGLVDRDVAPLHAAQSVTALRLGALMAFPLATATDVAIRGSYLAGGRFSGGGSAPFGVEIGLGVSYAPWWERVRVTGDLEFLRFDRHIATGDGRIDAPIQSSTARIGVMVAY